MDYQLLLDYSIALFSHPWARNEVTNVHPECWFQRIYTIKDLEYGETHCNAYLYNYLTCIMQFMADVCPEKYLKNSPECRDKFQGVEKNFL